MNSVQLLGRLTRDPEVRYSQSSNPVAVARYGIAVRRERQIQGQPEADFINVVAFGKAAEFVEKWFRKGNMILIKGRFQTNTWEDEKKVKHTSIEVVAENQYFTGAKHSEKTTNEPIPEGFTPQQEDDELPF